MAATAVIARLTASTARAGAECKGGASSKDDEDDKAYTAPKVRDTRPRDAVTAKGDMVVVVDRAELEENEEQRLWAQLTPAERRLVKMYGGR
jgi:hypothetical protein